jgi:hypothetical protein
LKQQPDFRQLCPKKEEDCLKYAYKKLVANDLAQAKLKRDRTDNERPNRREKQSD